jgi:hypothetical protein
VKKQPAANLTEYVFIFAYSLLRQLECDKETSGDGWRKGLRDGQEDRAYNQIEAYWVEFSRGGVPIPWLKIAALAMVAWVRENYPENLTDCGD